jgi:AcrR family transcriptional regulator
MSSTKEKGRPRAFDLAEALSAAQTVFCAQGYEGASLNALTEAMGINPPSLYSAFGSKEGLFLKVLDHYHQPFADWVSALFAGPLTTCEALTSLIMETAKGHAQATPMKGCLIVNSAIYACRDHPAVAERVAQLVQRNEDMIFARLEEGKARAEIAAHIESRKIACYINGLIQAMAVMARAKQSPEAVFAVAETGVATLEALLGGDKPKSHRPRHTPML